MTAHDLLLLSPILLLAALSVVMLLVIAFVRQHRFINLLTAAGFIGSALLLNLQMGNVAHQITPLIILDDYSRFFAIALLLSSAVIALISYDYLEQGDNYREEYYVLLSLAVLGAVVLVCSNHFASFFIAIELLSVSLFAMVGYLVEGNGGRRSTLEASIKYMILSGVSSSFLLFGVALTYAGLGVLSFTEIKVLLAAGQWHGYVGIGVTMMVIGLGFKLSWIPFHMWTPDVYQGAPMPVTAFLATVAKAAVMAILLRFFVEAGAFQYSALMQVLTLIALISMVAGNGLALLQPNLKRLLAYSSIAHMGYLLVAFIAVAAHNPLDTKLALEAVAFYLVAYLLMSLAVFSVMTCLSQPNAATDADTLDDYSGLFWRRPWLALVMTTALLSLAGIPLTVGFIGKFYLFAAGVADGLWLLLSALVLGSALGLFYYLRIIIAMTQNPSTSTRAVGSSLSYLNRLVIGSLLLAMIALGVYPQPLIDWISVAVAAMG